MDFSVLKTKQREIRDAFPNDLGLRVHRAISWLNCAEQADENPDARFIFYWIAFNAAYAEQRGEGVPLGTRSVFDEYFEKIIRLDEQHLIYNAIWSKCSNSIKQLLDNKYVFDPFWSHFNGAPGYQDWEERFLKSKKRVQRALQNRDTKAILSTLFDRMYVLRNQLVHGGATWASSVNREQVKGGANIMAFLVPIFIDLMMDNPDVNWGEPYYPVVE